MILLPTENLTYKTRLSVADAVARITDNTEAKRKFRSFNSHDVSIKLYEGDISQQTFTINRIIAYKNSFLPIIKGSIEKDYDGTTVNVTMRLPTIIIVFMSIWCVGVSLAIAGFAADYLQGSEFSPGSLLPFAMLIFGYGIMIGAFKYESRQSKKDLATIFDGEIV